MIKNLLFSALVLGSFNVVAQRNDRPSVAFGFKVGANASNMNFNKGANVTPTSVDAAWKTGLTVGLLMDVPLAGNLSVQPEYNYIEAGGEDNTVSKTYKLSYLSLPVLFKYRIIDRLSLMVGPQFDLLLTAKEKAADGTQSNITHDTEERNFGASAGLDIKITNLIHVNARYIQGINDIGIGQRTAVKEYKSEQAQLTAIVRF